MFTNTAVGFSEVSEVSRMFWFHSSQSSLLSTCTTLSDGDKDALKRFQPKLKGEQTSEEGNMEGGEREEGRKGMEARLACLLEKLTQMTDTSEFSRLT